MADQKTLIIGGTGQVGYELKRQLVDHGQLLVPSRAELDRPRSGPLIHQPAVIQGFS